MSLSTVSVAVKRPTLAHLTEIARTCRVALKDEWKYQDTSGWRPKSTPQVRSGWEVEIDKGSRCVIVRYKGGEILPWRFNGPSLPDLVRRYTNILTRYSGHLETAGLTVKLVTFEQHEGPPYLVVSRP